MSSAPEYDSIRELRRAQIVAEARALVAGQGLSALTIGALEERLPFSRGVITHHFDGKSDIVDAVLDSAVAEIDDATSHDVESSATVHDMVRAVLRTKVRGFLGKVEASRILVSFWSRIPSDPAATEHNAALFARYRQQSASLVVEGQRRGVFRTDADPEAFAALLVGQVIGLVVQGLYDPGAFDMERAIDAAARAVIAGLSPA